MPWPLAQLARELHSLPTSAQVPTENKNGFDHFLIVPLLVLILRSNSIPLPVLPSSGELRKTRAETSGSRHRGNAANRAQIRLSFPEGMKESLTRILLAQLPEEIAGRRGAVTALSARQNKCTLFTGCCERGASRNCDMSPSSTLISRALQGLTFYSSPTSRALQGNQQASGSSELGHPSGKNSGQLKGWL